MLTLSSARPTTGICSRPTVSDADRAPRVVIFEPLNLYAQAIGSFVVERARLTGHEDSRLLRCARATELAACIHKRDTVADVHTAFRTARVRRVYTSPEIRRMTAKQTPKERRSKAVAMCYAKFCEGPP